MLAAAKGAAQPARRGAEWNYLVFAGMELEAVALA
jgi:hypothetical protein